ncbi:hydrolase [Loktanella sp. D2R18]|uniref:HD domain-containing protein n=1 Tax=Rhodobacterales TaxID=204455 RepID=UPI000DEAC48D|nr:MULTISPECIES: HD domain-containing protein [Rhodobacterales]MDO6590497.1 HD domain-containing protein [Yoonia sp. 1_MG-2023]RBW41215.1 hydrolase [Loktanella sp. D2R18]
MHDALAQFLLRTTTQDSAHDIGHLHRVWRNAQIIADQEPPSDRVVLLHAAYLHDLVNLPKSHPDRANASARSAEKAKPFSRDQGLSSAQIDATCHTIVAHSFSANVTPQTLEAKIIQDADRIDALGAVGLARCFAVSGALGRPLFDPADPFATTRALDDQSFAIDHFAVKLLRLPETMKTTAGRDLAAQRADILRTYLNDLAHELNFPVSGW